MINQGEKVLAGELEEVKSKFGTRVLNLTYSGDSGFISSLEHVTKVRDYGNEIEIELDDIQNKDKVLRKLVDKISINGMSITEPSLNSIFIGKVKESEGTTVKTEA